MNSYKAYSTGGFIFKYIVDIPKKYSSVCLYTVVHFSILNETSLLLLFFFIMKVAHLSV